MKFRNYCTLVMGKFDKNLVLHEISKLSESPASSVDTGGILIVTYTSVLEAAEIGEILTSLELNNIVFDLDVKSSSVHLNNKTLYDGLFGLINNVGNSDLEDMTNRLLRDISLSSTTNNQTVPPKPPKNRVQKSNLPSEEEINKMTVKEKDNLLNKFIDNGLEKLSESEKKIIELLAK